MLQQRPNVLFIAVDDLRPDLGCYGVPDAKTPHIDRLAKRGVVFSHAYCQQAVCSPSRSSVMTGCRPDTTKVWDLQTHFRTALPQVVTLGQHFKNAGWFVEGMGKIYHGGYDDPPTWSVPWRSPRGPVYAKPENRPAGARQGGGDGEPGERGPAFECADVPDDFYRDGKTAAWAVESLRKHAVSRQPFFLAVGFSKPHLPFIAPKRYWDMHDPARIRLAGNDKPPVNAPEWAILPGGELRNYRGIPRGPIPPELARTLIHGYRAATSYTDALVGKLLDTLDSQHLWNNTIVVLWGDHGWKLGEHGAWCKHSNVENDTNAPLLVAAPGPGRAGRRCDALVEFVDIYPSLCQLAGLPIPTHCEGDSFVPLLDKPRSPWKDAAFSQYPRPARGRNLMGISLRTDRYRYTRWVDTRDRSRTEAEELYDHRTDPGENRNIAREPSARPVLAELRPRWDDGWLGVRRRHRERASPGEQS